jgi:hypothetical protein
MLLWGRLGTMVRHRSDRTLAIVDQDENMLTAHGFQGSKLRLRPNAKWFVSNEYSGVDLRSPLALDPVRVPW